MQPGTDASAYLVAARKYLTQAEIAGELGVDTRTVRRWELKESEPPPYITYALQRLLPLNHQPEPEGSFRFIDLFAGIGGMRRAFQDVGGRCVFTSEWDSYSQKTYAINFPDGHPIAGDITKVDAADVPPHDVLLAGFPCQPFSIAGVSKKNSLGRQHGFLDETQGTLFFDVARIIKERRPRAFLLENVKNLRSHDKGRTFATICRVLEEELKYKIFPMIVDGSHFTPQHRERILIVGFSESVAFDWNALPLPPKNQRKLREILHRTDGSEPVISHDDGRFFDHTKRAVNAKYTLTDHLWSYLQNYAAKHKAKGNGFGFGLVTENDVTRTLSARYHKDGSEILVSQGKKKNPRRLTPRECARLMGYPDSFKIPVSDTRAYQQFAASPVVPMIAHAAKLMAAYLEKPELALASVDFGKLTGATMKSARWNKEQLKLAFYLYCQLPFGKLDQRNREVISLSVLIGRTPSAVAMKLVNFASLDPAITGSGRKGLGNASRLDREVWEEFNADWESLAVESHQLRRALAAEHGVPEEGAENWKAEETADYTGETKRVLTEQRVKQAFFRRAVLSSYRGRCCISGTSEPRLLVASHIVPWSADRSNRLNPRNGLCLSALHDRAFDSGLISLTDNYRVCVSDVLKRRSGDAFIRDVLLPLEGRAVELPERFLPDPVFIAYHRNERFVTKEADSEKANANAK